MSSTKSDRIELTTGRIVTIVGVIIFLFIHFLIGIIIIVIGGIIQYGENSSMGSDTFEKEASVSCPKCGASHFYHYSDKDAFGKSLKVMQERASLIDAELSLESEPGEGTRVEIV